MKTSILFWSPILLWLGACASRKTVEVSAQAQAAVGDLKIYQKDDASMLQSAPLGTLPFFVGGTRGINIRAIKWNQPVTPENPGVDCDLTYSTGKGSSHFFRCIAKQGSAHIIASLQEDLVEGRRRLRRVFVDGKGQGLVDQWTAALERMGYQKAPAKTAGILTRFHSPGGETVVDLIWVATSGSATLRISPKF